MRSLVFPIVFSVAAVVALLLLMLLYRAWRERKQREDAEAHRHQEAAIKDAISKQILLPDGHPACAVCKTMQATETWPIVDTSWLDKVTAFKDLYALTPRYEVRDGVGERYELLLCVAHKRMCSQKWREVIASKRTKVQQLLSQIEADMAELQGGAMLTWLQREHELSMNRLSAFMGTSVSRLPILAGDDGPISMPPMSTKTSTETPDVALNPVHQNGDRLDPADDE